MHLLMIPDGTKNMCDVQSMVKMAPVEFDEPFRRFDKWFDDDVFRIAIMDPQLSTDHLRICKTYRCKLCYQLTIVLDLESNNYFLVDEKCLLEDGSGFANENEDFDARCYRYFWVEVDAGTRPKVINSFLASGLHVVMHVNSKQDVPREFEVFYNEVDEESFRDGSDDSESDDDISPEMNRSVDRANDYGQPKQKPSSFASLNSSVDELHGQAVVAADTKIPVKMTVDEGSTDATTAVEEEVGGTTAPMSGGESLAKETAESGSEEESMIETVVIHALDGWVAITPGE